MNPYTTSLVSADTYIKNETVAELTHDLPSLLQRHCILASSCFDRLDVCIRFTVQCNLFAGSLTQQ
jgi:hypothetical protein